MKKERRREGRGGTVFILFVGEKYNAKFRRKVSANRLSMAGQARDKPM